MLKEWLLKEEEKAKVGRPKLADDDVIKKSRYLIIFSVLFAFLLMVAFYSYMNNESPLKIAYSFTLEKMFGKLDNKNGFNINEYYNKDKDYVIEIKPSEKVKSYQGDYKYTIYELKNKEYKKIDSKTIKNNKIFKIKIKSKKNINNNYKIVLKVVNSSKIRQTYAPYSWQTVKKDNNEIKYVYKVFTVRGYYSPVTKEEIKEANKKEDKITVSTSKDNPRAFIINTPVNVKVKTSYTDIDKIIKIDEVEVNGVKKIEIPSMDRITNVTIKVYGDNIDKYKLSNWVLSDDATYIKNTYLLKPDNAY